MRTEESIASLLNDSVSRGIPGVAAAVATSRGIQWSGGSGYSDLEKGSSISGDTLFGIGSITKTLVAVIVIKLLGEGRLALTQTASSLLGEEVSRVPNAETATVAQLLNHTSGIPSWEDDAAWIRDGRGVSLEPGRVWRKTDPLRYVEGSANLTRPGERFKYSNTNYTLLGLMVEKVTGNSLVSELRRCVLNPLGLRAMYLEGFEPLPASPIASRYHLVTPQFRALAGIHSAFGEVRSGLFDVSHSNLSVEWAAGGMLTTARDLAQFGAALRAGQLLDTHGARLMTQWRAIQADLWVGHGLFRRRYSDGFEVVGHDGGVLGFTASLYWIEGLDIAVAVLANAGAVHSGRDAGNFALVGKSTRFLDTVRRLGKPTH